MKYVRTFTLQSAHLNSAHAYQILWDAADNKGGRVAAADVLDAMLACHGHNFKIVVELAGVKPINVPWLVDDVRLTSIVMSWDNVNLSVHPDFLNFRLRATTENMAAVLIDKLRDALGNAALVKSVTVHETADIYAVAE